MVKQTLLLRVIPLITLILSIIFTCQAQPVSVSLFKAERDLATAMQTWGISSGWLQYLDSAAVRYSRDKKYENAFQYWTTTARPGTFDWRPEVIEVSSCGQLGYTAGPVYYYKTLNIRDTPVYGGGYISVWKKNERGEWKVLFDVGTGFPLTGPLSDKSATIISSVPVKRKTTAYSDMLQAEQNFATNSKQSGLTDHYRSYAGSTFLLFAEGAKNIVRSTDSLANYIAVLPREYVYTISGSMLSAGGGLGYVYGLLEGVNGEYLGMYIRIWRREKKGWRIALEYLKPLQQ